MASTTPAPKVKKPTLTFMLHHPDTMADAGKYNSTSHRNAALKAATKGFETILLRQTNTKTIHKYEGSVIKLDEPKQIPRGDRFITYAKKPVAKFVESFEYDGNVAQEADPPTQPQLKQSKPKRGLVKKTPQEEEPEETPDDQPPATATEPAPAAKKTKRQIRGKNV